MTASDQAAGVSVVLATYNGECFLREQLVSIAAQTLPPAELVVSDDGSADATLDIVRAFAATAAFPVRILDKPARLGFSDNFLFAAGQCRHPLIAFCDQDDTWLPDKLAIGVRRLLTDDSLLSLHQLTLTDRLLRPIGLWDQGVRRDRTWQPLELNPWAGWGNTMIFRRELITLVAPERRPRHPEAQRPLSHDTWLYILAAALGRVSHIARPLILYRQHDGNAFGMAKPGWRRRLRTWMTVPVESYRERDIFFGHLADLFAELAERPGEWQRPAARAALRYRGRQRRAQARVELHDGPSAVARVHAYRRVHASARDDWVPVHERALSAAKDLMLGVAALGHHA